MAGPLHSPNLEAQRSAMQKLLFLVGRWTGHARLHSLAESIELLQTEDVQYRLGGLLLVIEGTGRATSTGDTVLQALALISYDDQNQAYRMRAFNDGRFLESQIDLLPTGQGMTWGFALEDITTRSILRIDETGAWTELAEITIGSQEPKTLLELTVYPRT